MAPTDTLLPSERTARQNRRFAMEMIHKAEAATSATLKAWYLDAADLALDAAQSIEEFRNRLARADAMVGVRSVFIGPDVFGTWWCSRCGHPMHDHQSPRGAGFPGFCHGGSMPASRATSPMGPVCGCGGDAR